MIEYKANDKRYENAVFNRCGKSGVQLPPLSLGLWQNFGTDANLEECQKILHRAFDLGINHFDLANNYGPLPGSAEENFGKIITSSLRPYRDELIISTKAGYIMWDGPYGNMGSKKYITASLDQSLKRMKLDYVDIFYHHRPDPDTPLEETLYTLDLLVKQGKALYVGISNYKAEETKLAIEIFRQLKTPFIIHQFKYNMLNRWIEGGLDSVLLKEGIGGIAFSPLSQGLLTDKYLKGIPKNSRAAGNTMLQDMLTDSVILKIKKLNEIAEKRSQKLSQMALSWVLNNKAVTSVLIGVSNIEQLEENFKCLEKLDFTKEELDKIDNILAID